MNLLSRLFAVACFLVAAHVFAADAFEGKVSLAITSSKGTVQNMDYSMKGQAIRIDTTASGHSMGVIMDMGAQQMTIIMHERHMYMVMPMKSAMNTVTTHAGQGGAPAMPDTNSDLVKTGKTETILGYTCHQVLVKDSKGQETEIWLAEGLGVFMGLGGGNPMAGMMGGRSRGGDSASAAGKWEQALKGTNAGFPLRVVTHDPSGKETYRMEATKIDPTPCPASDFAPPEDYQTFQMPGGMPFGGG